MVDVEVSTTIRRPRAEVAAYAADPETAPEWYQNIVASVYRTPKPLAPGSEVDFTARFLGKTLDYTYRVEEFVPSERLVMTTARGPFPMRTTYSWQDTADGTLMTLRNEGGPTGIAALADPLMAIIVRRTTAKELQRLKAILERHASPHPQ
ncbi:SRPBCC family protein [Sinomonas atrocyanea]|jgi:uncharacterized protein YndB with AHSA1/START domain|uniref:SRPBCC family protein n=1 Tax=Sinomonas atrocyanea TaxID=37927 RepID=UPI002787AB81|nr:SRPBCC family protein [Sinomonas atrocyanea]MDQ0261402.1 uncharacterized protein YndB with AHSA1/START domain [Sinomonas atrocyanea]MDR6623543.1 uncharacterized protein YndB with AHSA1/START domain [Sinomonas atrocyanea]